MSRYFKIETDKPALSYKTGEKMIIKVKAYDNCNLIPCKYVKWQILCDGGKNFSGLGSANPDSPLVLEASLEKPGFVHIICTAFLEGNSPDTSFDVYEGGVGAEIEKIKYCGELPDDYDEYWDRLQKSVENFAPKVLEKKRITKDIPESFESYAIKLTTPGAGYSSCVVTYPVTDKKLPLDIGFMGYGIGHPIPTCSKNSITFDINAHSIPNYLPNVVLEDKYKDLIGYGFNEKENENPETTYWQGMMIRDLVGVKYAKTLANWDGEGVRYCGGSQGAFQATNMAAVDSDTTFLEIRIPWFSNLNANNCGYINGWRPKYQNGTRYFDTSAAALRVKCPVKITAFLGDYCCPPSTQMALFNNFHTFKQLDFIQGGTHGYRPPEIEKFTYISDPENPSKEVKPGIYRHFKGNEYQVLYIAKNSETLEETVVYKALYGNGEIWVRPKAMWNEIVYKNGTVQKRFTFVANSK